MDLTAPIWSPLTTSLTAQSAATSGGEISIPDPTEGLTVTSTTAWESPGPNGAAGWFTSDGVSARQDPAVMKFTVQTPSSFTLGTGGDMFDIGGTTNGSALTFDVDAGTFYVGIGAGLSTSTSNDQDNRAFLILPTSVIPLGQTVTFVLEFNVSLAQIRMWINGVLVGSAVSPNNILLSGTFAGNNGDSYGFVAGAQAGRPNYALSQSATCFVGTPGDLLFYENQLSAL